MKQLQKTFATGIDSSTFSFLIFFLAALLIRLPFFFRDYIDRDESTFILMGQSWADGHLPYTQLWDLKPPLVFLFFAIVIKVFGKSFIAIRLLGALLIAATAFFLRHIGTKGANATVGFFAGLLYIYFSSLFGSLQGVMSEHLAMFFFITAFWILIRKNDDLHWGLAALLFGASLMFRLNLAYAVVLLYAYQLLFAGLPLLSMIRKGAIALLAGLAVPTLTFLPYWQNGIPEVWWNSVILASLNYDGSASPEDMIAATLNLLPFFLIAGVSIYQYSKGKFILFKTQPTVVWSVWLLLAGLFFMLIKSGKVNGHYLIQLHPFILLLLVSLLYTLQGGWVRKVKPYLWVLFLLMPAESYLEYSRVGQRIINGQSPYNGEGISVPAYIKENYPQDVSTFFLDYHIAYWLLKKLPPTKIVTHPSNLMRPSNYPHVSPTQAGPMEELRYILEEKQPQLIISRSAHLSFAYPESAENQFFEAYIQKHYRLVYQQDKALIYERIK